MIFEFSPDYDLALKALCHRCRVPTGSEHAPPRTLGHVASRPMIVITVLPEETMMHIEHHYISGHAEFTDDDRPPVEGTIEEVLGMAAAAAAGVVQADPDRWRPEVLLGLFTPTANARVGRVPPSEADCFELGRSETLDGKVPSLTLRLGRTHNEIVRDHSFSSPDLIRRLEVLERLEPPAGPEALAAIREAFGDDMARAAARFQVGRDGRFG